MGSTNYILVAKTGAIYGTTTQGGTNGEATAQLEPVQAAPPSLDQTFREHHAMVFRAAYRVTGNAGDAEDVLQTVFMRMLRRDPDAEAVGNMEGSAARSANAAVDLIRTRQAAQQVPFVWVSDAVAWLTFHFPSCATRFGRNRHDRRSNTKTILFDPHRVS